MAKYISNSCKDCLHYAGTKGCLVNHKWDAPYCGEYEETKIITLALTEDEVSYLKWALNTLQFVVNTSSYGILDLPKAEGNINSLLSKLPEEVKEAEIYREDYTPF